jgi:hypothetical protein
MAALYKLREASRRGKPFKWNKVEETAADTIRFVSGPPISTTAQPHHQLSTPPVALLWCKMYVLSREAVWSLSLTNSSLTTSLPLIYI